MIYSVLGMKSFWGLLCLLLLVYVVNLVFSYRHFTLHLEGISVVQSDFENWDCGCQVRKFLGKNFYSPGVPGVKPGVLHVIWCFSI